MASGGTPAIALVERAGIEHRVHPYALPERHGRDRDERPDYGLEAAGALGIEPSRVCKTIVAAIDGGRLVAAVLSVERQLDARALAAACGGRHAALADPAAAERATGSVVGGISPIAPRRPLPVIVDVAVMVPPTILVSAGRRGLQLELAPADLVRLTNATVAAIARSRRGPAPGS
jgi:Cys-tRNA(Pro)/Cys-tRNA(Cys) deacylase